MGGNAIFTRGFAMVSAANFLLFLSFYALMPVLPYFLGDVFGAAQSVTGLILASYSVACIMVRPLAGWMLDNFRRRPVYLVAYGAFMLLFPCYPLFTLLGMVVLIRFLHGIAFGAATVAGTTIVTYLVPKPRLGEGLGLYGLANTVSMAIGPMLGLSLHRMFTYDILFMVTALIVFLGLLMAVKVPVSERRPEKRHTISLRSLFLFPALVPSVALIFASVPYGMTTSYVALLADEYGIGSGAGFFYAVMAAGLGVSRVVGGKLVDRYRIPVVILGSFVFVLGGYIVLAMASSLPAFLLAAFLIGLSFGVVHPAFNTLFVRIGGTALRGTATSTYLTAWDLGIGLGILGGGMIAQRFSLYHPAFVGGIVSLTVALLIFTLWTFRQPHLASAKNCSK